MTRNLALVFLATTLAFSGCKKLQLPNAKAPAEAEQQPAESEVAAVSEPAAPSAPDITAPSEKKPEAAAAPAVETAAPAAAAKPAKVKSNSQVVVLCYHRIEGKAGGALSIEPALFEEQMQKIKDAGVTVISMKDFLAWRRGEKEIPPPVGDLHQ